MRTLHRLLPALAIVACSDAASNPSSSKTGDAGSEAASSVPAETSLHAVAPQDLSIAFPLPERIDDGALLAATDVAAGGELLDAAAFAQVGALDMNSEGPAGKTGEAARPGLRLLALRLDPCFGPLDGSSCTPQMRLVFQGLSVTPEGRVQADDGAVHVFVKLDDAELLRTVKQVLALKEAAGGYPDAPLGVHPILAKQGLGGAFAQGLRSIVLEHAGAARTVRVTFFKLLNAGVSTWSFGILENQGGSYRPATIATLARSGQSLSNALAFGGDLSATVDPVTTHADNLTLLLDTSRAKSAPPSQQQAAFDAALRIENPLRHTPDTIDCASCHAAMAAARSAEAKLGLSREGNANRFAPTSPVTPTMPARVSLHNLHAFSYLGTELGVSQRTANETAVAVERVNAKLR